MIAFLRRRKAGFLACLRDIRYRMKYGASALRCPRAIPAYGFHLAWSEYETPIKKRDHFGEFNDTRLQNMEKAASLIDGIVIDSGEIFHFWRMLGRPCRRNGFKVGPTIVNGALTWGYGGGLCQISSTLFNAFLEAGLEILERSNHSIDAHGEGRFIPLGRDAAVAYGYKDLIARNPHAVPLRIALRLVDDAVVHAGVYAAEACPFKVTINQSILERYERAAPSGKCGWKVRVQRFVRPPSGNAVPDYESIDVYGPCNE